MQVDRICRAEAAITIKQNKQKIDRGTCILWKGDRALSYNGAKTAARKHSFKSSAEMDGEREARQREPADMQMEKGEKRWTYEIINYASNHFIL